MHLRKKILQIGFLWYTILDFEIIDCNISDNRGAVMEQYVIKGGNPLVGEVEISGAKNAALAILAAAIMTDETVLIDNLPDVNDINVMLEAISGIGGNGAEA